MRSRNLTLIVGAVLIVAGAFFLAEYRNKQVKKVVYNSIIATSTETLSAELQNIDSDADGLKDWEEVLLGTDPDNADTDGDKTTDGKEAAAGRNPLIKGPNDSAKDTQKDATLKQNLTQTDIVARDFFARYMELSQVGLTSDSSSQAELIGQVLKNGVVLSQPKVYMQKDILVSADSSAAAIRKYGNEMGAIFIKYHNSSVRNEMIIAKESVDQEDPEILKEIYPILASYKNILAALIKVSAPQSLAQNHLDFINALSILVFSAESMTKMDTDTLAGIQGSSVWLGGVTTLNKAFNGLKNSFAANGITYTKTETGSFFIPQQ